MSLRYIAQYLSQLTELRLSKCWKIGDAGLAQLASIENLASRDLSGCKMVTNQGLGHLTKGNKSLVQLDCSGTSTSVDGLKKFIEDNSSETKLKLYGHVVARSRQSKK